MSRIVFEKYQGNGNDFIIIDSRDYDFHKYLLLNNINSHHLCNRNFGIGADGIVFILRAIDKDNDARMVIYNSDDSEAEMCGNGIRCLIKFLKDRAMSNHLKCEFRIETKAGLKVSTYHEGKIRVNMGRPIFENNLIPTIISEKIKEIPTKDFKLNKFECRGYSCSMGNPHLVFFVDNLKNLNLYELGPLFEKNEFFPQKTNVHFCKIIDSKNIEVLVWERGAGATLACGTGACAIHSIAFRLGYCGCKSTIKLPGGILDIEWGDNNDEVYMTGEAKKVFSGEYSF